MKVVTARIYIRDDEDDQDPREVLADILTTYSSGLIDPEEREEILLKVDLLSILNVTEAFDPADIESLEEVHSSQPYLAEG